MERHRLHTSFVCLTVLLFGSLVCLAQERVLVVGDEELRFTPIPERGYVVKLREGGHLKSLDDVSGLDVGKAKPIRGLDPHGLWTVENVGSAVKNKQTMTVLRRKASVTYIAPLFSANGETVVVIPELVIRVRPDIELEQVEALSEQVGCTLRKHLEFTEREYLLNVHGLDAEVVFVAVEMLNDCPEIEWACPNTTSRPRRCGSVATRGRASDQLKEVMVEGDDLDTPI